MSLSVCTQKVRITSPNGTFLSEGETRCSDIATLKNLGYTIEELEEPTQPDFTSVEEVVEPKPVEEPVVVQEPETIVNIPVQEIEEIQVVNDIFVMQADLLINRSLELATANVNLQAEKQQLTTQVQTLQNTLAGLQTEVTQMPFANEKEYHEFLLLKQVEKIHGQISTAKSYVGNHPKPEGRKLEWDKWINLVESQEVELEKFARNLGLNYSRRSIVDGENIYYNKYERELDPILKDDWVSYIPTSSAVKGSYFN
tara:strand:- start:385 stop:1152 length:768 start_codon:yes stop_codon:yes gene_type:complete